MSHPGHTPSMSQAGNSWRTKNKAISGRRPKVARKRAQRRFRASARGMRRLNKRRARCAAHTARRSDKADT